MGRRYSDQAKAQLLSQINDPEAIALINEADDPVYWAERHFYDPDEGKNQFRAKRMFHEFLRCPRKNRSARIGRQAGKTVHFTVDLMHTGTFNSNAIILVFVPSKKNMDRTLEIMSNLLMQSDLKSSFQVGGSAARQRSGDIEAKYDNEIRLTNGSVIRFFFMSQNPDKARGQRGTHIYIDEADYLPDKAWPVITGVIKGNPGISVCAISTPRGIMDTWFRNFCDTCGSPLNTNGEEFHIPTSREENWPEIERRLRDLIFDDVTWKLEVLAEWSDAKGAVYKKAIIDNAIERSRYGEQYITKDYITNTLEYRRSSKFLGVDWNTPQNGVRIIEIAYMFGNPWLVRNEIVSHEEYTQTIAVDRIFELHKENKYTTITLDAGYGETQIELLNKKIKSIGQDASKIMSIVDSTKKEETIITFETPDGGRRKQSISTRLKTKIVGLLAKYLEEQLVLLQEDDCKGGVIREMRNFIRKETAYDGGFIYSENTHSLSALQLCIHGFHKFKLNEGKEVIDPAENIKSEVLASVIKNKSRDELLASPIISSSFRNRTESRTGGLRNGENRRSRI